MICWQLTYMDKISEINIRKIQKVKRSYYVTLPISYVRELGWDKKRDVIVMKSGKNLLIRRAREKNKA